MKISAFLYDSKGNDEEIEFGEDIYRHVSNDRLLWVTILERDRETIERVIEVLDFKNAPVEDILRHKERPKLEKFENFYRIFIVSVQAEKNNHLEIIPIDFIVKKNVIVSVHSGGVGYFEEFRDLDKGETQIGKLNAESIIASLLDLHLVGYFTAIEGLEKKVDKLDEQILTKDLSDDEFLKEILELRHKVSKLRRLLLPHRDVFYALSRPDFLPGDDSDSNEYFQKINDHFESAVASIESSRDTVLSLFNLFATKSSHNMNNLMRRLTFVTLLVGGLGAIAGIWGMNFEVGYFKAAETGFWMTMLAMGLYVLGAIVLGKFLR